MQPVVASSKSSKKVKSGTTKPIRKVKASTVKPLSSSFEKSLQTSLSGVLKQTRRAVVDIGSNSVRLVIYDGPARAPLPICNEKALCGLGRGLSKNGRLNENAVKDALDTLIRFRGLLEAYDNPPTRAIATAAVREAQDGHSFVKAVKKIGFDVEILSGEDEAKYAALGVLSFTPLATGLVGDMGGGSLELSTLKNGQQAQKTSLSIGPLRLMQEADHDRQKMGKIIDQSFDELDWLKQKNQSTLYAVGGAWRAIAKLHMGLRHYPLSVLHHYTMSREEVGEICSLIERQSRRSLENLPGIPRRRLDTLPVASLVLDRLLTKMNAKRVRISVGGVREGIIFNDLDETGRGQDPLIVSARFFAEQFSPAPDYGQQAITLTKGLFPNETYERARLRAMICLMMDIGAYFHPDHRGHQAFDMVIRAPTMGLTHEERLIAARALYRRYKGFRAEGPNDRAISLLSWEDQHYAMVLGLALRFIATFAPKVVSPLIRCKFMIDEGKLIFVAPADRKPLMADLPLKRLQSLGNVMELDAQIDYVK